MSYLASNWRRVVQEDVDFQWAFLAPAWALVVLQVLMLGFGWHMVLRGLVAVRPSPVLTLRAFYYSLPGKYVPGRVAMFLGRMHLLRALGLPPGPMLSSFVYEASLQLLAAFLIAAPLVLLGTSSPALGWLVAIAIAAMGAGLLLAWPRVLHSLISRVARVAGQGVEEQNKWLSRTMTVKLLGWYVGIVIVSGLGLFFTVNALTPYGPSEIGGSIGTVALAGAMGIIVVVVPSGLGVREGVIVGLLSLSVPLNVALTASLLFRVVATVAELTPGAVFGTVEMVGTLSRKARHRVRS